VRLHVATPIANVIFELAADRVERVANRDVGILMRVMGLRIATHGDFPARDFEDNADAEQVALLVARMPALDDNPAGYDPIKELLEFLGALAYSVRNRVRGFHMTEGDLEGQLPRILLSINAVCEGGCYRCRSTALRPTRLRVWSIGRV